MQDAFTIQRIEAKYRSLQPVMDERMRRQWAAAEATAYGWGGIQAVAHATGLSPTTIRRGQAELAAQAAQPDLPIPARLRQPGGGRKRKTTEDPELVAALERLVDPVTRGDPDSPLLDLQEHAGLGPGVDRPGAPGQRQHRPAPAARGGV